MIKQAPTVARIAAMVVFALSCFGLLLFLWISFGGPVTLKPTSYKFKVQVPEAALLIEEADVRMAGLNVGKVKDKELRRHGGTLFEVEMDPDFAPIPADTRAIVRQKTLLGQLYLELTPGSQSAPKLEDGGVLRRTQVEETTEIDEIIRTFDPETRHYFRGWVRETAKAIKGGTSQNLNDAIGNFQHWARDGSTLLRVLDEQEPALQRLVRNSGIVFAALNQRYGEFRELVVNANNFFGALASQNDALAETISIFPTFLDESRATLNRLRQFAIDTHPLVRDLIPVAILLRPTLVDLGRLAPHLEHLFRDLDVLIRESPETLPHAARFLRGARPVLKALHTFLPELNPFLSFANFQQQQLADFIMNGSGSLNATLEPTLTPAAGEGWRHYLRQFSIINARGVGIQRTRPNYERGLAYPAPNYLKRSRSQGIAEAFDCKPTNGEQRDPEQGLPPCLVQPPSLFDGLLFPRLSRGEAPLVPPPLGNEGTRPTLAPGSGPP